SVDLAPQIKHSPKILGWPSPRREARPFGHGYLVGTHELGSAYNAAANGKAQNATMNRFHIFPDFPRFAYQALRRSAGTDGHPRTARVGWQRLRWRGATPSPGSRCSAKDWSHVRRWLATALSPAGPQPPPRACTNITRSRHGRASAPTRLETSPVYALL